MVLFFQNVDEQIGERLIQFKEDFKNMFRKTLQQKHQDQLKSPDDEVKQKVEKDIEIEVEKNQNRIVDDLIQQMRMKPEDWKEKLQLDKLIGHT